MTSKEILLKSIDSINEMMSISSMWRNKYSELMQSVDSSKFAVFDMQDAAEYYIKFEEKNNKDPLLKAAVEGIAKSEIANTNAFHKAVIEFMSLMGHMEFDLADEDPIKESDLKWLEELGGGYYIFTNFDEDDVSFRVEKDPYQFLTIVFGIVFLPQLQEDYKRFNEILGNLSVPE